MRIHIDDVIVVVGSLVVSYRTRAVTIVMIFKSVSEK
jgi:hypothetical protein